MAKKYLPLEEIGPPQQPCCISVDKITLEVYWATIVHLLASSLHYLTTALPVLVVLYKLFQATWRSCEPPVFVPNISSNKRAKHDTPVCSHLPVLSLVVFLPPLAKPLPYFHLL